MTSGRRAGYCDIDNECHYQQWPGGVLDRRQGAMRRMMVTWGNQLTNVEGVAP
jgi:hypothetical protein